MQKNVQNNGVFCNKDIYIYICLLVQKDIIYLFICLLGYLQRVVPAKLADVYYINNTVDGRNPASVGR